MASESEAINAAQLRVTAAERSLASHCAMVASSKQSVQMASQMLESAKAQLQRAQSDRSSSEKELEAAKRYLKSIGGRVVESRDVDGEKENCTIGAGTGDESDHRRKIRYSLEQPKIQPCVSPVPNGVTVKIEPGVEGRKRPPAGNDEEGAQKMKKKAALRDGYQISVERTTGSIMTLDVKSTDTVRDIKGKIPLHPDAQVLRYGGTTLEDENTLSYYNVTKGSTLALSFNLSRYAFIAMTVHVKTLAGKSFAVHVAPSNIIRDIKNEIQREEGIPPEHQRLIYVGRELNDDRKLSDYGISSLSVLQLVTKTATTIPIRVETVSGQSFAFDVAISDTVKRVKEMLKDKVGTPTDLQRLVFAGSVLDDGQPLSHYNVQSESTLHLVTTRRVSG